MNEVDGCFDDVSAKSSGFGVALFGGRDDVGHYEDVVFVAEIAGGGSEDCFGADVEFAIAVEGHADVVFAEEFGDFDGRGKWMGRWGGGGWNWRGFRRGLGSGSYLFRIRFRQDYSRALTNVRRCDSRAASTRDAACGEDLLDDASDGLAVGHGC